MKTTIKLTLAILLIIAPVTLAAQEKNRETATVKFNTSIDCQSCVNTIMKNIPFEKGVKDVKCDLSTKQVTIEYQPSKTSSDTLKRSIEKLGYTAKEAKPGS